MAAASRSHGSVSCVFASGTSTQTEQRATLEIGVLEVSAPLGWCLLQQGVQLRAREVETFLSRPQGLPQPRPGHQGLEDVRAELPVRVRLALPGAVPGRLEEVVRDLAARGVARLQA